MELDDGTVWTTVQPAAKNNQEETSAPQSEDLQCSVKTTCPVWKNNQGRDRRRGENPKEWSKPGRQDARCFHQSSQVSARWSVYCASIGHLTCPWESLVRCWCWTWSSTWSKEKARAHPSGWYRHCRLGLEDKSWDNPMVLKMINE